MPEEKKEPLHPEVTFLPPLEMILSSSSDREEQKRVPSKPAGGKQQPVEKTVARLIEKLSEKDE